MSYSGICINGPLSGQNLNAETKTYNVVDMSTPDSHVNDTNTDPATRVHHGEYTWSNSQWLWQGWKT